MNILSNFFGTDSKNTLTNEEINQPKEAVAETQVTNIPPIDLFVDEEEPEHMERESVDSPGKVTQFLNRNFYAEGLNNGHEYHAEVALDNAKNKIKAEFLFTIDQVIQERKQKRLSILNLIVDVRKLSEPTVIKLENTLSALDSSLSELSHQKELTVENEGWVMSAIHSYHQGFVQGMETYIDGHNLINSINNF